MADLSQQEWISQLDKSDDALIIDVRTDAEIKEGYIPEALHMDIHQGQAFIEKLKELDKDKEYFIYCRSGARSGQACAIMNQLGISKAYNLSGGIMEYKGELVR